ncbi:MAG: ABC transporter ATP-binding protein, partial [Clostridiaceae bacterium]|nr:ABC transporter ATP-binding protein [Clostridiaceae bacterium]
LERERFGETGRLFFESRRAIYRNESYNATGVEALVRLLTGAVTVFGALAITRQTLDLPDLITFLLYIGSLTDPIMRLVYTSLTYQNGMAGFLRFQDMMSQEPDIRDRPDARDLEIRRGDIRFDQVTFRYQGTARPVLANLDLVVRAGETVALVGPSGAGKTTLCSLIPRFYDVEAGSVRIDGVDVRDVRLASLRGAIGIVQQDVFLFAGTVAENIRYGNPGATDAELVEAARQSGAHAFIEKLPHGYDTEVGERGVRLSGGQKQRISLARVFLKNPSILIFDEATSALDLESEREIRASMARLATGRTTLIIAHRLSTVRNADRLVVLTDDGIEEQGTHEELLRAGGTYARLYGAQMEIDVTANSGFVPGESPLFAQAGPPEESPSRS